LGTIIFSNHGISPRIKDKAKLKKFLCSIFQDQLVEFERVNFIFCKDDYLLKLNQQYLGHNFYTDILTFNLSSKEKPIFSEIYISVDRVNDNAGNLKISSKLELYRVMIHGILHLCQYSDHSIREKKIMREKEDYYLNKLSFT
jgi:rRNA maturation RNase YbeY